MKNVKNPFPRKSVISPDSGTTVPLYTLVTPQVEKASQIAVDYLEDGIGQVITVQGPYGSGKSHIINFCMQRVQQVHSTMEDKPRLLQIYQRATGADFVSFYREMIKKSTTVFSVLLHFEK
jgi:Cdc6-like AAA superfamily ATPase